MSTRSQCSPPSSSLPSVRSLASITEEQISTALRNLHSLYCPLRLPVFLQEKPKCRTHLSIPPAPTDSGYASGYTSDNEDSAEDDIEALRNDAFERAYATRWLTRLISRADSISASSEPTREQIVDAAASVLASFCDESTEHTDDPASQGGSVPRESVFPLFLSPPAPTNIRIVYNDAPLSDTDHLSVGLSSWGAGIRLAELLCATPERFGLTGSHDTRRPQRIVELGAGTGVVSLVLGALLPYLFPATRTPLEVIATDFHAGVLANLVSNIERNFSTTSNVLPLVQSAFLDWSAPSFSPPLDDGVKAEMLFAADVVYVPEHAGWLRDCATRLLAPDGVFWMLVTVREVGRFEGLEIAVEREFGKGSSVGSEDGKMLRVLDVERLEKRKSIGRGNEGWYKLYRIGWTEA